MAATKASCSFRPTAPHRTRSLPLLLSRQTESGFLLSCLTGHAWPWGKVGRGKVGRRRPPPGWLSEAMGNNQRQADSEQRESELIWIRVPSFPAHKNAHSRRAHMLEQMKWGRGHRASQIANCIAGRAWGGPSRFAPRGDPHMAIPQHNTSSRNSPHLSLLDRRTIPSCGCSKIKATCDGRVRVRGQ